MPEIIDPVFAKTSQNARFLLSENERFGLVFVKTGSINSGTVKLILKMSVIGLFSTRAGSIISGTAVAFVANYFTYHNRPYAGAD